MTTKTVGEILKEERQRYRMTLSEVARRTRIRQEYLTALESNDFRRLPAAAFVKGYIKAYAKLFGFDPQPLVAVLRRDYKQSAKGRLVPREFLKPVLRRRLVWGPVTLVVLVVASLFVTLLGYVGFQWHSLNQPPQLELSAPADNQLVAAQIKVAGRTEPEATVLVNAQPVAIQPDGSFQTEVFVSREGLTTITVEASDRRGKTNLVQRTVTVRF
ncbi:MAG: hypothetical protein COU69_02305 [Candidatus Pacebacteria bacterium CG10_big_fil_rev_8_21_14_0_10_56_10]|nr:MAG: hypothetical protein COU69_02305 [Candidatus Pacebacteria bacterium CG10_big_fil_rev_8_21_14_0_10_56_10]